MKKSELARVTRGAGRVGKGSEYCRRACADMLRMDRNAARMGWGEVYVR